MRANFLAASLHSISLLAPVHTMRPDEKMSAVVLGARMRMMRAAKRFGLYSELRACRAIFFKSNLQARFIVATMFLQKQRLRVKHSSNQGNQGSWLTSHLLNWRQRCCDDVVPVGVVVKYRVRRRVNEHVVVHSCFSLFRLRLLCFYFASLELTSTLYCDCRLWTRNIVNRSYAHILI